MNNSLKQFHTSQWGCCIKLFSPGVLPLLKCMKNAYINCVFRYLQSAVVAFIVIHLVIPSRLWREKSLVCWKKIILQWGSHTEPLYVFVALCSVTSFNTHPHCAIGCPTALKWRTTPWSAPCAWSHWRLTTSTSFPAPAATRSAASVGIASAQTRTASAPPAERWGKDDERDTRETNQNWMVIEGWSVLEK